MTDTPEHLDLSTLVIGELDTPDTIAAGAHLDSCATCRAELVDAVVGHALMTRTSHTLDPERSTPPPLVGKHVATDHPPLAPLTPIPLLNRRHRPALIGLAAAAALAVVGTTLGITQPWADEQPRRAPTVAPVVEPTREPTGAPTATPEPQVTVASATLGPLKDSGRTRTQRGTVTMTDGVGKTRMEIELSGLPSLRKNQFYYAWLLDPDTNKMLPLGQVSTSGALAFDLDPTLVSSYSAIDVSLEDDDGNPEHSPVSVLRGSYSAATEPGRLPGSPKGERS